MKTKLSALLLAAAMGIAFSAQGKLPPPPPLDEAGKAAAEAKKVKDAEAAEKAKAAQAAAEDKAVGNFQGNMKKAGKPIPKPTPIVAAAPAAPAAAPAKAGVPAPAPAAAPAKPAAPAPAGISRQERLITMNRKPLILPLLAAALLAAGCATTGGATGPTAVANLASTKGNTAAGKVTFAQKGSAVQVSGTITGLKPNGEHGFHVHEKGDCSSGDGMSAGGHFNPQGKPHGHHGAGERHAGDMPNLKADAYGTASFSFEVPGISVGSGTADVVGKGLIVHRDPDDYKSQPAGNAGPRLACAVIAKS